MKKSSFDLSYQNVHLPSKILAAFERISTAHRVLLWDKTKDTGLSPIQIQILIFLKFHSANLRKVSELAKEFSMSKSTISDAVKTLERKKLLGKQSSSEDKRIQELYLTEEGEEVVEEVEFYGDPIRNLISDLGYEDQSHLFRILSSFTQTLHGEEILKAGRSCISCSHFRQSEDGSYCEALEKDITGTQIRIDCPEHKVGRPALIHSN